MYIGSAPCFGVFIFDFFSVYQKTKGLLNHSILLVFTFLHATNQKKTLTLNGTLDFHINLAREKKKIFNVLNKAMKNDLNENNPKKVNDHALTSEVDEDKCTQLRDDKSLSRSSIFEFIRLQQKLRFQENEEEWPRIPKMVRFITMTML